MFMPFVDEENEVGDKLKVVPYDSLYILFWYLGEPSCDGHHRVCDAYVLLWADADDEQFVR